jgi:hypothetical protein
MHLENQCTCDEYLALKCCTFKFVEISSEGLMKKEVEITFLNNHLILSITVQWCRKHLGSGCRPVIPGCAGGALAPPDFYRSVNPISTKGADYAHQKILAPPDFQTF